MLILENHKRLTPAGGGQLIMHFKAVLEILGIGDQKENWLDGVGDHLQGGGHFALSGGPT